MNPSKAETDVVFTRLRAVATNKVCFDCNAKNPTWSSVTYGVFICIDCSAVHRSLGVHLTFVRSTQLDTNWTWLQIRQMQLGGNANAKQFFEHHNCHSMDSQKKYNSRAAQLYKDKLLQQATNALISNELHIHPPVDDAKSEKEEDFFTEEESFTSPDIDQNSTEKTDHYATKLSSNAQLDVGPKVDFSQPSEERKSTITVRKVQPRKTGLGAKKMGMGATKVKANFADVEREASMADASRERAGVEAAQIAARSRLDNEEREAAVRLAYQDIESKQQKQADELKKTDPRKAEQVHRLGMGFNSTRSGVSHSAMSDMATIEQENSNVPSTASVLSKLGSWRISEDSFFDDFSMNGGSTTGGSFSNSRASSLFPSKDNDRDISASNNSNIDSWLVVDSPPSQQHQSVPEKPKLSTYSRPKASIPEPASGDAAQKKFGNAKGISSDQYFDNRDDNHEVQTTLNRFQGSSSISSADLFGTSGSGNQSGHSNYNNMNSFQAPDLDDVRESVRQGVTKVAGKLSSLANGMMSSLQDKYGY